MKEIWKDVVGYEGHYKASNLGRIKSLKYNKENILIPLIHNRGYLKVNLHKDGKRKSFYVHKLIAMTFLDKDYVEKGLHCDHVNNGDRQNNAVTNLQLTTHRHNISKDRTNRTGYTGVCKVKSGYVSQIQVKGDKIYLGIFDTPELASEAYQRKLASL